MRAKIVEIGQLSAHAGKSELLRWLSGFKTPPRQTFLVHGEPAGSTGCETPLRPVSLAGNHSRLSAIV